MLSSLIPDDGADVILIDCPRKIQYHLPHDFIEEVKNGFVINEKYQCAVKRFTVPLGGRAVLSCSIFGVYELLSDNTVTYNQPLPLAGGVERSEGEGKR